MKHLILTALMGIAVVPAAKAQYLSGPQVLGCDVVSADKQTVKTDICLIISEGNVPGGDYLLAVRVGNNPQTYLFKNTDEFGGDVEVFRSSDQLMDQPVFKAQARQTYEACRAIHAPFERYNIRNGIGICLYRSR